MRLHKTYISNLGSGNQRMYSNDVAFMYFAFTYEVMPSTYEEKVGFSAIEAAFKDECFQLVNAITDTSETKLSSKLPGLKKLLNSSSKYLNDNGSVSFIYSPNGLKHPNIYVTFDVLPKGEAVHCEFSYYPDCVESLKFIESFLIEHKFKKNPCSFSILHKDDCGLSIKSFDAKLPKNMNLDLNYGEGFEKNVHETIVRRMNEGNGLYLLHGNPGTGKSTYIKHLASCLPEKTFVYIPDFMLETVITPDAIGVFIENKNLVLVLEDAEKVIASRETPSENPLISTLLNLTDGILSDILDINVIVSYNTETEKADQALLRKGRLRYKHEFKEISSDRAKKVLSQLNLSDDKIVELENLGELKNEMSLGEIYYILEKNGIDPASNKKESFGFK